MNDEMAYAQFTDGQLYELITRCNRGRYNQAFKHRLRIELYARLHGVTAL